MTYRKDEELASCSRRGCAVGLCSWNRLDLPIKAWSYLMRNETIKNCSFSLRNGEEVASVVAFPRCSQCSQQCLLCHCRGLVGQSVHSVPLPPLSLPSLSRACTSSNSPLLKPRGFTQAFFGYVQLTARLCGQQAAAGPTEMPICQCPCVPTADPTPSPPADGRDVAGCTGMWRAASAGSHSRFQERSVLY